MSLNFKNVFCKKRKMKLKLLALSFLLFSLFAPLFKAEAFAYTIKDPRNVVYLEAIVHVKGTVDFFGTAKVLQINITVPINTSFQKSIPLSNICKFVKDKNGNVICEITAHDVYQHYAYDVSFLVKVREVMPYKDSTDPIYYLQATKHIQSDLPIFKTFAENISKDYLSPFEKIASLSIWVNKNLRYDLAYGGKNMDALWVLRNRKGVCAEYSTLFIAFARSLGIPARYVHVYAFGENGWESHAIAEAYINGKWYPVDPLWLEVGSVDATHIYFGRYLDNQVSDNIFIKGYSVSNVQWKNSVSIETKKVEYGSNINMDLSVFPSNANIGSDVVLVAKENCKTPMVDKLTLKPCKGIPIIYSRNPLSHYIICENKTPVFVYWQLRTYDNLSKEYIYTCPLTVNSLNAYPGYKVVNVKVSPEGLKSSSKIEASPIFIVSGLSLKKIPVLLSKRGEGATYLYAVGKNFIEKEDTTPYYLPHTFYFYIQPWKYGSNNILFFMDDGSNVNSSVFVKRTLEGKINSVVLPNEIPLGGKAKIKINYYSLGYGYTTFVVKGSGFESERTFYAKAGNNSFSMIIGPFNSQGANEIVVYAYKKTNDVKELIDVKTSSTLVLPYQLRMNRTAENLYIHTTLPSDCFVENVNSKTLNVERMGKQDFLISTRELKACENITLICKLEEKDIANPEKFVIKHTIKLCPESLSQKIIEKSKVGSFISKALDVLLFILNKIKILFNFAMSKISEEVNSSMNKGRVGEVPNINGSSGKIPNLNVNAEDNLNYSVLMGNPCLNFVRENGIGENEAKAGVVEKYKLNGQCYLYFSKITLPDPCHKLEYRVEKRTDHYAFIFRSVNLEKPGQVCIQVLMATPVCIVACGENSGNVEVFYER